MTSLLLALASFVLLGFLVTGVNRLHESRTIGCLTATGVLCLYLFIVVILGG